MLEKLRALFASAPKTLPQATETLGEAKATLDSVAALFTAAGLPLEQMLATGPDALKAHLASLDKSADVTRLTGELTTAKEQHALSLTTINQHVASIEAFSSLFTAIGLTGVNAGTSPTEAKAKWEAHVSKQTTLALAKTGHPPAHVPAAGTIDDVTPPKNEGDAAAKAALTNYEALITADNAASTNATRQAKLDFYTKNHALIDRGIQLRRRG